MIEATRSYLEDLELLSSPDGHIAEQAFNRLWLRVREPLVRRLRSRKVQSDRCEDVVQGAAARVWAAREGLDVPSPGAWWRLVCKVSSNLLIDEARKDANLVVDDFECEIPDCDMPYLDIIAATAADREALYDLADRVWLSPAPEDSKAASNVSVLATQLFYVHGMSATEICAMLDIREPERLDDWLTSKPTLLRVAFGEIYLTSDALAGFVIRPEAPFRPAELDRLGQDAHRESGTPPKGWSWDHILLALWRIRNGLLTEQILRFDRCRLGADQLDKLFRQWCDAYPFRAASSKLVAALDKTKQTERLQETGLWRRIVFQYHAAHELAYKQILERTAPAAEVAGVSLTETTLGGWIGMGRLWSQLATALAKEAG